MFDYPSSIIYILCSQRQDRDQSTITNAFTSRRRPDGLWTAIHVVRLTTKQCAFWTPLGSVARPVNTRHGDQTSARVGLIVLALVNGHAEQTPVVIAPDSVATFAVADFLPVTHYQVLAWTGREWCGGVAVGWRGSMVVWCLSRDMVCCLM